MKQVSIVGIDPGLVHTGIVLLGVDLEAHELTVGHRTVPAVPDGTTGSIDAEATAGRVHGTMLQLLPMRQGFIFIEKYRDRGTSYGTNTGMRRLEQQLSTRMPEAKLVDNTGSRHVTTPRLLSALGLEGFPTTHHQDLEAAARIAVYGAVKNDELNKVLYEPVSSYAAGRPWPVVRQR